jgi:hypothetical protein
MTDDLKPCPFCGGGITTIEGGGQTWRGVNGYSDPQFYHLRHFGKLSETDDFPRCFVEFRCRTEAEAIAAWNTRALTEQLEAARADAKEAEAYAEELEAKVENLTKHHANMADPRYWEGRYRDEKAKLAKAVEALGSIELYGSDTLSGRTDGPADAKWHREGVKEMRDRARTTLAEIDSSEAVTPYGLEGEKG